MKAVSKRRTRHPFLISHLMAVTVIALVASALVLVGPGVANTASAQVVDEPVDCANPAPDVVVILPGEALPIDGLVTGTYAFGPGIHTVDEQRTIENDVRITSCDPTNPAVLVAGSSLPVLSYRTFGLGTTLNLRITT